MSVQKMAGMSHATWIGFDEELFKQIEIKFHAVHAVQLLPQVVLANNRGRQLLPAYVLQRFGRLGQVVVESAL